MTDSSPCSRCGAQVGAGARFCSVCGSAISPSGEMAEDQLLSRLRQATLGEYDVLRELGRGGMAAVYLAWDRELARYVAIKVLLPELAHQATMSQRFLQEARTAANLDDHPSVVRVYRAKESQGLRYFVMKYVDGCSLDLLLRATGPLPFDLAAHVVDQVALALQYAHEHGVVHRDVKPGNVLLDRAGGVVVTDFGIAKIAEGDQLTRTGFAIGTPHYMSPEQWRVEPLTPAADQYALGVVAYHLLTGATPFDGTQYEIQEHHLRSEPPPLAARRSGVSPALGAVVGLMLAKRAAERFPDLRSVSQALAAIPRDPPSVLRERLSRLIPAALPAGPGDAASASGPGAAGSPVSGPAGFLRPVPFAPGAPAAPAFPATPVPAWQQGSAGDTPPAQGPPFGGLFAAPGVPPGVSPGLSPGLSPGSVPPLGAPAAAPALAAAAAGTASSAPPAVAAALRPPPAPLSPYAPPAADPLIAEPDALTQDAVAAEPAPPLPAPSLARPDVGGSPMAYPPIAPSPIGGAAPSATASFGAPVAPAVGSVPDATFAPPLPARDTDPAEPAAPAGEPEPAAASFPRAPGGHGTPVAGGGVTGAPGPEGAAHEDARPEVDRSDGDVVPLVTSTDVPPARARRRSLVPVLAIGGLAAAAGVFVLQRREPPPPQVRPSTTDGAVAAPRPDSGATAVAAADTASVAADTSTIAAGDTGAIATSDTALIADGPAADTAAVVARDTTALIPVSLIINGRVRNEPITLAQGDSVRLAANVTNARRQRIQRASVAWQSSDPARIVFRRPWAVAVGAGGPVTVTATSGRLRNAVQINVAPRPPVVAQAPAAAVVAAPTDAEVRAAVDEFVAALRARNFDELSRRMGERAGDGSPTREFFDWVRGTRGFGVERPTTGRVGGDGTVRSVALRTQLRYTRGGLIKTAGWADAVFNIGLRHGPNGWRGAGVQLARRVTP